MTKITEFTDDQLITELENRGRVNKYHEAEIRLADFSMKHTMRCQPNLFECNIHQWLQDEFLGNNGFAPVEDGHYSVREIKGEFKLKKLKR